jgi:hypothetical protein
MAEKDTIFKGKIKQKGIFNFEEFYKFSYDHLNDEGYDVTEKSYSETIAGDAKEIKIQWEAKRKISDYFTFLIKMQWQIVGMKKIKVKKENKEVSMNSGDLEIKFAAVLVKDYESRWEDAPIWKFLRGLYDRYIIRSRIDDYEDRLMEELDELISQCKSFLTLEGKK